jgi:hypothetical protein
MRSLWTQPIDATTTSPVPVSARGPRPWPSTTSPASAPNAE